MKQKILNIYLFYVNNLLSIQQLADYYNLDIKKTTKIIDLGRKINHFNYTGRYLKDI
jgi:hypothetical protein